MLSDAAFMLAVIESNHLYAGAGGGLPSSRIVRENVESACKSNLGTASQEKGSCGRIAPGLLTGMLRDHGGGMEIAHTTYDQFHARIIVRYCRSTSRMQTN